MTRFGGVRAYLIRQIIVQYLAGGPRYARVYVDRLQKYNEMTRLMRARRRAS